jgi:hypothetical protein
VDVQTADVSIASPAEVEQCWVVPDVFVTRSIEESPPRRQCEVLDSARATLRHVRNVERLKKVCTLRELSATRNVPSTRLAFGGVPETVQRLEMKRVEGNAGLLIVLRSIREHVNALT